MSALGGTLLIIIAELAAVWLGFEMGRDFSIEAARNKRAYWRPDYDAGRKAGEGKGH